MRMSEVARTDSKGRVVIPSSMREALGVVEGMYVMLMADTERRELTLVPFADPKAELVQLKVTIPDAPGSLARVARVLADANVDLLASESRTLQRGKLAEWYVVADVSKRKVELKKVREGILSDGGAEGVEIRPLSAGVPSAEERRGRGRQTS